MTLDDPFASAPAADEAQTVQPTPEPAPAEKPSVGAVHVDVKPRFPEGFPGTATEIVTTFKAGASFDQPWVVLHAGSVSESNALLDQEFADYLAKVKKVASFFNGGGSAPVTSGSTQRQLQPGQPAGSVEAPSWAPPKPFEDFVYVTKVSKNTGKPWHAWMPPGKDDAREPKFFYPPR